MLVASPARHFMSLDARHTHGMMTGLRPFAFVALITIAGGAAPAEEPEPAVEQTLAPIHFRVVVEAPRSFRQMLEKGLDIARWQGEQRVTMPLLERLVTEARVAAAEALAAEGYFSADVKSAIETPRDAEATVRITVTPGPRTLIR
jgi:uncharacterized membrane protein